MAPGTPVAHAKWAALFKKHIGVLEAHVKLMERLQMSMRSEMKGLSDEEQAKLSAGEKGNWKVMEEMAERSREVLQQARGVAKGILPAKQVQPKKTARQKEREEKDRILGASTTGKDNAPNDTSKSEEINDVEAGADYVPLTILGKRRRRSSDEDNQGKDEGDANPYFVVDVEPTPVTALSREKLKKAKKDKKVKRASDLLKEPELIGKKTVDSDEGEEEAIRSKLESTYLVEVKDKKKKRRRSERSEVSEVEQDAKKLKKEEREKEKEKKRKAEESESRSGEMEDEGDGKRKRRKHNHKDDQ